MMYTKWDLIDHATRTQLSGIRCDLKCSECHKHLDTEADFAKHFIVPDIRFLNLGWCPEDPRFRP